MIITADGHTDGRRDRQMGAGTDRQTDIGTDRRTDGQAKNNRAPSTRWRGPTYILDHTDVLIKDKHVFVNVNTCTF